MGKNDQVVLTVKGDGQWKSFVHEIRLLLTVKKKKSYRNATAENELKF